MGHAGYIGNFEAQDLHLGFAACRLLETAVERNCSSHDASTNKTRRWRATVSKYMMTLAVERNGIPIGTPALIWGSRKLANLATAKPSRRISLNGSSSKDAKTEGSGWDIRFSPRSRRGARNRRRLRMCTLEEHFSRIRRDAEGTKCALT